jgi:hypothetical protein
LLYELSAQIQSKTDARRKVPHNPRYQSVFFSVNQREGAKRDPGGCGIFRKRISKIPQFVTSPGVNSTIKQGTRIARKDFDGGLYG